MHHPNTKRFKRTLTYFNTDTQCANFQGNPLYQATKQHLNSDKQPKTIKYETWKKETCFGLVFTPCLVLGRLLAWQFWCVHHFFVLRKTGEMDAGGRGQRSWSIWPARKWNIASTGVMPPASCVKISWQLWTKKRGSCLFLALLAFCCFETASVYLSVPAKTFEKTFKGILSENLSISFQLHFIRPTRASAIRLSFCMLLHRCPFPHHCCNNCVILALLLGWATRKHRDGPSGTRQTLATSDSAARNWSPTAPLQSL